jgi:hypothetical protein
VDHFLGHLQLDFDVADEPITPTLKNMGRVSKEPVQTNEKGLRHEGGSAKHAR